MMRDHTFEVILLLASLLLAACQNGNETQPDQSTLELTPPYARPEITEMLREDLLAPRHPADGGGRAWIDKERSVTGPVTAASQGTWTLIYEAGPLGIDVGGAIFFLPSPFWGWSAPQTQRDNLGGFTEVSSDADGIDLEVAPADQGMLGIRLLGRGLAAGEHVTIRYGAGSAGAQADRFAEHGSRFWISVDGDGDGVRKNIVDSPLVDIVAAPPALMILTGPTTARPGERVRFTAALLDSRGNAGSPWQGTITFEADARDIELPRKVSLRADDLGRVTVEGIARREGTHRVHASTPEGLSAESNPLVVSSTALPIWWADLHGHSNFSDGTGTPQDFLTYARDVAALDVVALTDHDHWGTPFLDQSPEMWGEIRRQTQRFHQPGRFVTLLGYEWTNWIYGHRHVLYFGDDGDILSSIDRRFETPQLLWEGLRGKDALTVAHHSAGGPIATDWSIPPDAELEPVTEVVSVHGVSEADDSPATIYNAVRGNFVRDALGRGYRLGFVGSGDSHDGHPGLAHLGAPTGGLAAIVGAPLTRRGVHESLQSRHVYATSGPRILLQVSLDGEPMGSIVGPLAPDAGRDRQLRIQVVSPGPLDKVQVIRSGKVARTIGVEGDRDMSIERAIPDLQPGEYIYVRVIQRDAGMAWSSPIFVSNTDLVR